MAVVDNASGITMDASGQHMNSKVLDGLPAASATGQAVRYDEAVVTAGTHAFTAVQSGIDPTADAHLATKAYTDTWHPATVLRMGSDFATGFTGALSSTIPVEGAIAALAGAGAAVTVLASGGTDTIIGVAQCTTGTTTTGIAVVTFGASTTSGGTIRPVTASKVVIDVKVSIATLSGATDTFDTRIGLCDSFFTVTNGIWFSHDANSDAHWIINTKGAGTTSTATTVSVVAGQEYHLLAIKAAGGDSVTFFIDGVSVGTIATNVPTGQNLIPGAGVRKTAGTTARTCNIDWAYFTQVYARAA